jgi:two-component system, NarL family, sensor histidine kinase DesK
MVRMIPFAAGGSAGVGERAARRGRAARAWTLAWVATDAPRRATAFVVAVMCLLLVTKVAEAAALGMGQVPWAVALFVLPLLYALPGPRRLLDRYRWPVLAVQAVLTWAPLAVFGASWETGFAGLLAGLVLLMVPGRVPWVAAGLLLAADVLARASLTGLPLGVSALAWSDAVWVIITFLDDVLWFFGMVRLAQIVGEVEQARRCAGGLAVARERLRAAEALQSAVGQHLAGIAEAAAAARQALPRDAVAARAQVTAAGTAARGVIAQARAAVAGWRGSAGALPPAVASGQAVIGARLAWAVLAGTLVAYPAEAVNNAFIFHDGLPVGAAMAAAAALTVALQLRHSGAARNGRRPRGWPVTLGLQAALVYVFFLPGLSAFMVLPGFLAGSVLLMVPGRWRWAWYGAVIVSYTALYATVPLRGIPFAVRGAFYIGFTGASVATVGLLVYGLTQLAGLARELEGLRGGLAHMAAVRERLRVGRDVHDLLGLGLSAIALKADLAAALIGRDDTWAATEIEEMSRICAAVRADIRLVATGDTRLSLASELAAAGQILTSAGVTVMAGIPDEPLPAAADEVLAPVLREAVTNVLRHAAATTCRIEVTASGDVLRLRVGNDGVPGPPAAEEQAAGCGGRGLANLNARLQAVGGRLTSHRANAWFDLTAEIPLVAARPAMAGLPGPENLMPLPARPTTSSQPRQRCAPRRPGCARRAW